MVGARTQLEPRTTGVVATETEVGSPPAPRPVGNPLLRDSKGASYDYVTGQ